LKKAKFKTVHIDISEQQWRQFAAMCRLAGSTIGKTILTLIEKWIRENRETETPDICSECGEYRARHARECSKNMGY